MKDVLSDILDTIELKGALYFRTDFSPPFAIGVPAYGKAARFHLVVQGRCHVTVPGGVEVLLQPGDLILIPYGSAHVLSDVAGRGAVPLENIMASTGYRGEGTFVIGSGDPTASTQLVCGHYTFAEGADHPLLHALPKMLHLSAEDRARQPILDDVLRLLVRRIFQDAPGTSASISRLSEVLYIEVLRAGIDRVPELQRMFTAVHDPQIGKALSIIHQQLDRDWTVESLGSEVGMSRSRFAERFRELVGTGPMGYLTDWRLQKARLLLGQPHASVKEVAYLAGYRSPTAFSRAYAQKFGHPPKNSRP
ncbi:AraC family transcriptional regulator [Burkholderia sp. Bp9143]|uniref:AraC family transcriptional regulator n=1 Tax=Burkholderia sp. Bp9143 TaxID=2184574 RepID=UPI000F59A250|nr:AraC family transcriptional regulator [Burkholderia sp. Bp9143]RQR22299.1 AraC family transcriptional regulator [Burkholderia sp. Bp9143]